MENAERIRELIEAIGRTKLQSEAMKRMVAELLELLPNKGAALRLGILPQATLASRLPGLIGTGVTVAVSGYKLFSAVKAYRLQKQRERVWK